MRFSSTGEFLATGGVDSVLRIFRVVDLSFYSDPMRLFHDTPFREYKIHKRDIVDISWSSGDPDILVTASHDKTTIIWNIRDTKPIYMFSMPSFVTSVSFQPGSEDIFATGSFDKIAWVWSIKHKNVTDWVDIGSIISSMAFSLDGERLVVGTIKGSCQIFDTSNNKLMQLQTINVKNRIGIFSKGRKVTEIKFLSNRIALVQTGDSRIREIDLNSNAQVSKFKGHRNEEFSLKADMSED